MVGLGSCGRCLRKFARYGRGRFGLSAFIIVMFGKYYRVLMNFTQAKKRANIKFYAGVLISLSALASTAISILKMFYFTLPEGYTLAGKLAGAIKALVELVYRHTSLLELLWVYSPAPDFTRILTAENLKFFIIYLAIFIGSALVGSARKMFKRLKAIQESIEDQLILESIKGEVARTREEIEASVSIPKSSIFTQFNSLYLAPLATTVVGGLVLKFVFGIG